jgi:hypothetical protein
MTPTEIIRTVRSDGITIAVSGGELRVTGKAEAVKRWLPEIRAHKPEIIHALSAGAANDGTIPMTAAEESAIRRWLAHIEEHDPELIAFTIDRCRASLESREYFLRRSGEVPLIPMPAVPVVPSCTTCIHRRGRHDTHWGCLARDDLPPLYGEGHPLRELPEDGGATCLAYRTAQ